MEWKPIGCTASRSGRGERVQAPARVADPCAVVMFGATGDLARRKLVPALYNLTGDGLLNDRFAVVGIGRQSLAQEPYREKIGRDVAEFGAQPSDARTAGWLEERASYLSGDYEDEATYQRLREYLTGLGDVGSNLLFYLATPPSLFGPIIERLGSAGLVDQAGGGWRRVVVEKPFGRDLPSARTLNERLRAVLEESQVYRIDHYLGKETVQNIMAFRFGNGIFEPIWNRRYVDHVQITVAETLGIEQRGGYYDTSGALRDMVQNHLFQLLAVTALEPPASLLAGPVRDERLKVLHAIRPFTGESVRQNVVRGQYGPGRVGGESVPAYRSESKVRPDSQTETYVALKVLVDNWRWADVPFYLRTGKRLPRHASEIVIQFKRAPLALFRGTPVERMQPNRLVLGIQPREGISLQFEAKVPGAQMELGTVNMDFCYGDYFGQSPSTGYETLLYDCMTGDATLFNRADIVEAGWEIVAPILDAWQRPDAPPVSGYAAGAWGPDDVDALLGRDGRAWHEPLG
jgi:glucose-6-phosphate 1-dehydrogenase